MSPALPNNNRLSETRKKGLRILAVSGSSGGHIFPALGLLDTLKEKCKDIETLLVLTKGKIDPLRLSGYKVNYIWITPVKLSFDFKNTVAIFRLWKGFLKSVFILLEFKPDIVVGFGSLSCLPLISLAWIFRIKTLIHEQNVVPGRANRFLAKFVDRVTISFSETKDYFIGCQGKIAFTGNPMRKELIRIDRIKALRFFGLVENKFTVLVMGGSLGSHRINMGVLKTIKTLFPKYDLQIIHISGLRDYDFLKRKYKDLNVDIKLFGFLESMQYAYSACDLVISRAGATTIAEIIFFGLPAIIIPYPYAYKHQLNNAKVLENKGCAVIIEDNKLDTDILSETLESLINNPVRLKSMRSYYNNIPQTKNANDLLLNEVLSLN